MHAALTTHLDVAQVVLYVFWGFLAAVIFYLRREDKREGYPLESDRSGRIVVQGYPAMPAPKTFKLADGSKVQVPSNRPDNGPLNASPIGNWPGAPLVPNGNPMEDGVGPAAYANRSDTPDLTVTGAPKIVPLRNADGFHLDAHDPDPRSMNVVAADGKVAGVVRDIWIDQSEYIIRYLEVEVAGKGVNRTVLVPATQSRIGAKQVKVNSILSGQFAKVPGIRNPGVVTRLEEDRICAYYAGGNLYATPARAEPLL